MRAHRRLPAPWLPQQPMLAPIHNKQTFSTNSHSFISIHSLYHASLHPHPSQQNHILHRLNGRWRLLPLQPRNRPYASTANQPKPMYILPMFPYPSGNLHMGHARVYTISDILARYHRQRGHPVIHPIGWDAFGLPAENAAVARGINPSTWTSLNIADMRRQLLAIGADFDWNREINTSDPEYYRWTQFLFLRLWRAGLVVRREALVNWDPVDATVLANEQVTPDGRAERSGAKVILKKMPQWFVCITQFADALLDDLEDLDWPENVKRQQTNWIGRQRGVSISIQASFQAPPPMPREDSESSDSGSDQSTTETEAFVPEGAGEMRRGWAIAALIGPYHPWVDRLTPNLQTKCRRLARHGDSSQTTPSPTTASEKMSTKGVWTGLYAHLHAAVTMSGSTASACSETTSIPVIVTSDMLQDADKCRLVVAHNNDISNSDAPTLASLTSFVLDDTDAENMLGARQAVAVDTDAWVASGFAQPTVAYRLRDWLISRQRSWGTPIPIVHCPSCGTVPVPEKQLPVLHSWIAGPTKSTSTSDSDCTCPKCSGPATREKDTMDTFVDSSWYWLRYLDPRNTTSMSSSSQPVDIYIGGVEHAIMHLLYVRFIAKFMHRDGIVCLDRGEPIRKLVTQGMVLGETCRGANTGTYFARDDVDFSDPSRPKCKATGEPVVVTHEKMSKSKHNGVNPTTVIDRYGSDAVRLHILYRAAPEDELAWDDTAIVGMQRFLARIDTLSKSIIQDGFKTPPIGPTQESRKPAKISEKHTLLARAMREALSETNRAFNRTMGFPVAIASLIKLTHAITNTIQPSTTTHPRMHTPVLCLRAWRLLITLLYPFAPVTVSRLVREWATQGAWPSLFFYSSTTLTDDHIRNALPWPSFEHLKDLAYVDDIITCVVQINGKKHCVITDMPPPLTLGQKALEAFVRGHPSVAPVLDDMLNTDSGDGGDDGNTGQLKTIRRVVVAGGGRLVNFVVA